ncbi:RNA polymerase-binding protein RbpA [Sediminivirga luteola]|uniref:RNA polymerase-binding protein RbpA n=1 Tax=Sediminivirga luteola TaxID=1774748 RepID=A0A8J2U0B0_9MICO|nr:RNA polymerase-binding protein RbpA [Sediminivirga luteola]MCI2264007.1 RNA polymerase-binding protein RbpA [Sediminivirga luteola]GGA23077.1 RNA polymerase-binding protein RbpA [Sediminivirga luteola]
MSERSLRGTQLGSRSLESDAGVEPAPRQVVEYVCEDGHTFSVPFSVEADVPQTWDSGKHGIGVLKGSKNPDEEPEKPARTHWDMLLERRSLEELQVLLDERLEVLRSSRPSA